MKYLAVLGREPALSLAELEALFSNVRQISDNLATFEEPKDVPSRPLATNGEPSERLSPVTTGAKERVEKESSLGSFFQRLGGCLKIATPLNEEPLQYLSSLPDGKITFGLSDYSKKANKKSASQEALKLKKILIRHDRSVRVVPSDDAILSTATSLHNGLAGKNPKKVELIKFNNDWYRVIGVQDIDAYSRRDQARPARDARVGMLPPKLAQILINLCGPLPCGSRILDPFCGTGVVLQEALLMGYRAYGTDISERMIEYSKRNLEWLVSQREQEQAPSRPLATNGEPSERPRPVTTGSRERVEKKPVLFSTLEVGDATTYVWNNPISAVACEAFLGQPMSTPPADIKLKQEKQKCKDIILGFLKNLNPQIAQGTPVVIAVPAWLRENGTYSRLEILDLLPDMGYNVSNKSREGLLYYREGQIVARDIIILRKK